MKPMRRSQSAFTLAEMAVAFFILALLLAGSFIPLSTQVEVRNIAETRRIMDQVRDALIGFVQANGRLPCPARGATPAGTSYMDSAAYNLSFAAGVEQYDTGAVSGKKRCLYTQGVVPWSTLGVPETDSWGRRFSYRVSPAFADDASSLATWQTRATDPSGVFPSQALSTPTSPADQTPTCDPTPAPTQSSFALCSLGDIAVLTRSESDHATITALGSGLPVIFVSHGRNGIGAYQPSGVKVAGTSGTDETANSTGTGTYTVASSYLQYAYYSRNPTPYASTCDDTTGTQFCEFDDLVGWISSPVLVNRTVTAGRLP
jgi:hypothetical protein